MQVWSLSKPHIDNMQILIWSLSRTIACCVEVAPFCARQVLEQSARLVFAVSVKKRFCPLRTLVGIIPFLQGYSLHYYFS